MNTAKGPDCTTMDLQTRIIDTLGPDLGEFAMVMMVLAGGIVIVALLAVLWRVMDWAIAK